MPTTVVHLVTRSGSCAATAGAGGRPADTRTTATCLFLSQQRTLGAAGSWNLARQLAKGQRHWPPSVSGQRCSSASA